MSVILAMFIHYNVITNLPITNAQDFLFSKRDTNRSCDYRFCSKIPGQRVYHQEPGRLMFLRSLQQTFISLHMIHGIR